MRCAIGLFAAAAGVVACAGVAGADPIRPLDPGSIYAFTLQSGNPMRGPGMYSTGFEASQGFVIGPIAGQDGWAASGTNNPAYSVSAANPHAGDQHLRMAFDQSVPAGTQRVVFGPNQGALTPGVSSTSVMVNISGDGGADYDVVGQAPSQGFLSWRVKFRFQGATAGSPGTIYILDDIDPLTPGNQLGFLSTSVPYNVGAYTELRVDLDHGANTIQYYYGGSLIHTSAAGVFAGTTVEQFVLVTDNWHNPGEVGDFDNVSIIPAPGSLALLGMGIACAARRRRS